MPPIEGRYRAPMEVRRNIRTGAFVHVYRPLRIYVYDHRSYPDAALNFLTRILLDPIQGRAGHWYLFERWSDWRTADFLLHPADLNYDEGRETDVLTRLDHLDGYPERHLFIDHRDCADPFGSKQSIHLKASLSQRHVSPRVMAIPYLEAVDDFRWYLEDQDPLEFDLCFIGEETPFRSRLIAALADQVQPSFLELRRGFYHESILSRFPDNHGEQPAGIERKDAMRRQYIKAMRRSRFALAPCGFGLNSFRFFEALSLGVPPILVSTECALPFADVIDYPSFCYTAPADVEAAALVILAILRDTSPDQRNVMAERARSAYDRFLSSDALPVLIHRRLSYLLEER